MLKNTIFLYEIFGYFAKIFGYFAKILTAILFILAFIRLWGGINTRNNFITHTQSHTTLMSCHLTHSSTFPNERM